jgi:hypothetical protein
LILAVDLKKSSRSKAHLLIFNKLQQFRCVCPASPQIGTGTLVCNTMLSEKIEGKVASARTGINRVTVNNN